MSGISSYFKHDLKELERDLLYYTTAIAAGELLVGANPMGLAISYIAESIFTEGSINAGNWIVEKWCSKKLEQIYPQKEEYESHMALRKIGFLVLGVLASPVVGQRIAESAGYPVSFGAMFLGHFAGMVSTAALLKARSG